MWLAQTAARAHAKGLLIDPPPEVVSAITAFREASERVSHRDRCPFGTCPSCDDTIEVGDSVVLLSKSFVGVVLATHGPYLWVDPANPGEHPRSWMAECCARIDPPAEGTYWLAEPAGHDTAAPADLCAELVRLRAENKHLAGALERATVGQTDPVSLRLGIPPADTAGQPPPDLDEMRRLVKARAEHGCVAASVWLHDLQWILDALADSIPLRPQHRGELDCMPDQTSTEDA